MKMPKPRKGTPSKSAANTEAIPLGTSIDSLVSIKVGDVTITTERAHESVRRQNVARGQQALRRAADGIRTVGVTISETPGIPLYRVDPQDPDRVIRQTGNKVESGQFLNGVFRAKP
ncbi:hypothetical protein [Gemmatimonas aurantiaca]|uniref:hypothetical protein n=1 Tax=Gemmatimonas aurantiaca TaxID=173480 RepID=UPI0012EA0C9D|nr:hypothetical protein [Gemmatimonas aurantiaca]